MSSSISETLDICAAGARRLLPRKRMITPADFNAAEMRRIAQRFCIAPVVIKPGRVCHKGGKKRKEDPRLEKVRQALRDGLTLEQIVERIGVPHNSRLIYKAERETGLYAPRRKPHCKLTDDELAAGFVASALTLCQYAKSVHVAEDRLRLILRSRGIKTRQGRRKDLYAA